MAGKELFWFIYIMDQWWEVGKAAMADLGKGFAVNCNLKTTFCRSFDRRCAHFRPAICELSHCPK